LEGFTPPRSVLTSTAVCSRIQWMAQSASISSPKSSYDGRVKERLENSSRWSMAISAATGEICFAKSGERFSNLVISPRLFCRLRNGLHSPSMESAPRQRQTKRHLTSQGSFREPSDLSGITILRVDMRCTSLIIVMRFFRMSLLLKRRISFLWRRPPPVPCWSQSTRAGSTECP
jgi:hypothetical protein